MARLAAHFGPGRVVVRDGRCGDLAEFTRGGKYALACLCLHLDNRMIDMIEEGVDVALRVSRIGDDNLIVRKLQPVLEVRWRKP